ncbi:MAG: transporter [Chromatiales bacterium]|nr:transporter [Chromatiales bacterium]
MHEDTDSMTRVGGARLPAAALLALSALGPLAVQAQTPARFYLDTLSGSSAVPLIVESVSGNTNPFDPAHTVTPGADFDATLTMVGYARTFTLFDRSALAAIILPMGRISGDVTLNGRTFSQSASGFGDPMLEFDINLHRPAGAEEHPGRDAV